MGQLFSVGDFDHQAFLRSDNNLQSLELDEEIPASSKPRHGIHPRCEINQHGKGPLFEHPIAEDGRKLDTIWSIFAEAVHRSGHKPLYGTRKYVTDEEDNYVYESDGLPTRAEYVWSSFSEIMQEVEEVAAGIVMLGAETGNNIGIFSVNRVECSVAQLAFQRQKMTSVPLYATLGLSAIEYILNHADLEMLFVSKENLPIVLDSLPKLKLKTIVQFDPDHRYNNTEETVDELSVKRADAVAVKLIAYSQVKAMGRNHPILANPPTTQDLFCIMYTSGTTGPPKGAMLSHSNMAPTIGSLVHVLPLDSDDVHLSYLPQAHSFECVVQTVMMSVAGRVGFFQGSIRRLKSDLCELQPTLLCGVPRVFSKIHDNFFSAVSHKSLPIKALILRAYQYQVNQLRCGKQMSLWYDNKVFCPARALTGLNRVRRVITGAAPCPPHLFEFLKVFLGGTSGLVVQGYGMTETAAAIAITNTNDPHSGHTGPPLSCTDVRLEDVPEMGYSASNNPPTGEICVKGPTIFQGYYKNEADTQACIDEHGWLHTGDIGRFNANGTLSIVDRKKNIFKLARGEYISAEKIEIVYDKSPVVAQFWLFANSFKEFVVAVVVPSAQVIYDYAQKQKWWPSNPQNVVIGNEEFLKNYPIVFKKHYKELHRYVLQCLRDEEKGNLQAEECVYDIILEYNIDANLQGFTEANDCITPTSKLRRTQLYARYREQLMEIYTALGAAPQPHENW